MSQYAPPPAKIGGQKRPKIWHKKSGVKKTVVYIYTYIYIYIYITFFRIFATKTKGSTFFFKF